MEQITVVKQEEVEKALTDKIKMMKELIVQQDGMIVYLNLDLCKVSALCLFSTMCRNQEANWRFSEAN
jgi:hypothetical protein